MQKVFNGRFTVKTPDEFVVFLIGMRVNKFWSVRKWLPVASAMPKMLKVLASHPEKGFLGGESFFRLFPVATMLVSYWRSFDDLDKFARNPNDPHLKPWGDYMKRIGSDGSVGIWHETYKITKGHNEAIYGNMPLFGMGKVFEHVPVTKNMDAARQRIGA